MCLPNFHVLKSLCRVPQPVILFWDRVFTEMIKLNRGQCAVPQCSVTIVFIKRGNLSQKWWCVPIIQALWSEAGRGQVWAQPGHLSVLESSCLVPRFAWLLGSSWSLFPVSSVFYIWNSFPWPVTSGSSSIYRVNQSRPCIHQPGLSFQDKV